MFFIVLFCCLSGFAFYIILNNLPLEEDQVVLRKIIASIVYFAILVKSTGWSKEFYENLKKEHLE